MQWLGTYRLYIVYFAVLDIMTITAVLMIFHAFESCVPHWRRLRRSDTILVGKIAVLQKSPILRPS